MNEWNKKLREILDDLQSEAATDDLSNDWEGQLEEALASINQLVLELIGEDEPILDMQWQIDNRELDPLQRNQLRQQLRDKLEGK